MRRYLNLLALCAFWCASAWAQHQEFHIVLDPGHGGSDSGIEHGDLREKDLTLAVAKALEKELAHRGDIMVTLTRKGDDLLSFNERRRIASSIRNGVFLSLHFATAPDRMLTGTHLFMQKHTLTTHEQTLTPIEQSQDEVLHLSYQLGEHLRASLHSLTEVSKLHVAEHSLIPLIGISIPAVLVELDYLSGLNAVTWLNHEKQLQAAKMIIQAIDRYRLDVKNPPHEQADS